MVWHRRHQIPETHQIISEVINVEPTGPVYGIVEAMDVDRVEELARNANGDELIKPLQETLWALLNPHLTTYVNLQQYQDLLKGRGKTVGFHSVLQPSVLERFCNVLIIAANFEQSLTFKIWSDLGVKFRRDKKFEKELRYSTHQNGHLLEISYFLPYRWSKRLASKLLDENETVLDRILKQVLRLAGDQDILIQLNKGKALPSAPNIKRLPNKPHGRNDFSQFHNVACLSAANLKPDDSRFMEFLGLDREAVREAIQFEEIYQSALRISLRDPHDGEPKRLFVPDQGAAEFMAARFPEAKLVPIQAFSKEELEPGRPGRPRKYNTSAEKSIAARARNREKKIGLLRAQAGLETSFNSTPLHAGTIYECKTSKLPLGYVPGMAPDELIDFLREAYGYCFQHKEENWLISPAIFDPEIGLGYRQRGNIKYLRHIWLDFEEGKLSPDEFPQLFPHVQMLVCNSFNHSSQKPRFRVLLFASQPMTPEASELGYDCVEAKLRDAGYWVNKRKKSSSCPAYLRPSGLDWSKRAPTSLFYLPSQAADPKQSFFELYEGEGRAPIDVQQWIEAAQFSSDPQYEPLDQTTRPLNEEAVQIAISEWRQSPQFPNEGNDRFFRLGVGLRAAGMTDSELQATLNEEFCHGQSPEERRRQIPTIMRSLRRSWGRS